jgi:DNA-binding LacI/PurR family transcriptional regulator
MADIARLAGVSVSTVSRALAGSTLVNEATRQRVSELARSLNYTINVGAQNLRLKQNRTIAVVVPYDPLTRQHLSDPFFLSLIGSLADALTARGYEMLLSRVDADRLDLAAQSYEGGRAAGIILVGQWHHHPQLNEMAVRGVPLVVWGAQLPGQVYATVGSDNVAGGSQLTTHLIARGARHIVFFGDTQLEEIGQRHRGYLAALKAAKLKADPDLQRVVPFERAAIEQAVEALLNDGTDFDAIFCASDLMAMTVIGALQRHGRRVPQDVLVGGYDDIALAAHYHPALSTVRQPIEAAGEQLVEALLAQLEGQPPAPRQLVTELVVRDSTRRP